MVPPSRSLWRDFSGVPQAEVQDERLLTCLMRSGVLHLTKKRAALNKNSFPVKSVRAFVAMKEACTASSQGLV